ncbi:SDR family oxidoreductase [Streptomyces longispororuber]|uniref:SDR family oxidoreductase n=1 Tax=Streptomyces longispororuber TaxID=68230 RepID=UPI0033E2DAC2
MSILLTGATGFVGCRVLRELLADDPDDTGASDEPVTVLGRGTPDELRARVEATMTWLTEAPPPPRAVARLCYVSGDIERPGLGLSAADRARTLDGLREVWHSAALLNFMDAPAPLHRANVRGTRHVLDLLEAAPAAELRHISTAYVAGRRSTGHVLEDDLSEDSGFMSRYEESKYTAERLLRAWSAATGRAVTVLRPSLLVSDRPAPEGLPGQPVDVFIRLVDQVANGWTARGHGVAELLRGGLRGDRVRVRVEADPEGTLNLLQVDHAARAMVRAAAAPVDGPPRVRTLHVTHPRETPFRTALDALATRYPGLSLSVHAEVGNPTRLERTLTEETWRHLPGLSTLRRTYDRTHFLKAVGDLPDPDPVDEAYLARAFSRADLPTAV